MKNLVLSHDSQEIRGDRLRNPDAAVAAAMRMLCRTGDELKGSDVLKSARTR